MEESDYWGQARQYTYDSAGYLTSSTDPLGRAISYVTDPLGRIVKKILPNASVEEFAYDANGYLIEAKNQHGTATRQYDAEGRLVEEAQDDFLVKSRYDANGNRVARETSFGNTVTYEYDALDQLVAVRLNEDKPIRIERDAVGRISCERLGPWLSRHFQYAADGNVTEQTVLANESPLFATRFEYDAAGNLSSRNDSQFGVDVYRYDPLGRITEHLNPQQSITHYLNDPAGDRLRTQVIEGARPNALPGGEADGQWSREGEYAGTYYRFDRAGNLIERRDGQRDLNLTWDANQRLMESRANGVVTRYGYDPLGRRLFKETGGIRTLFCWDGDALVGEVVISSAEQHETPLADDQRAGVSAAARESTATELRHRVCEYIYYVDSLEPLACVNGAESTPSVCYYHNDLNGCRRA